MKVFWLALAGAGGALCRVGLSAVMARAYPGFPWGTLTVNAVGSFAFGLIWALCDGRSLLPPDIRWIVLGGFMGAFTTFSTFAFETVLLLEQRGVRSAATYIVLQNVLGIGAAFAGIALGKTG